MTHPQVRGVGLIQISPYTDNRRCIADGADAVSQAPTAALRGGLAYRSR